MSTQSRSPLDLPGGPRRSQPQPITRVENRIYLIIIGAILLLCVCAGLIFLASRLFNGDNPLQPETEATTIAAPSNATLTIAVSPAMAPTFEMLAAQFNAQNLQTPDGQPMIVQTVALEPDKMVAQSLGAPAFQAIAPYSSLWLNQLEQRWAAQQGAVEEAGSLIPIGDRRIDAPLRYATSPIVIVAWESVARDLGWPLEPVGWEQVQRKATRDPDFKWSHPSTNNASGLLATLAEFYAGAGLTRGLTEEAATAQTTLDYVRAVEATVRFYGEGEAVIMQRLASEGRDFLDAFVAQEQVVIAWNQLGRGERLVALYPAEGTLWADHPLALLELGANGEAPVTPNQRNTYRAFGAYITGAEAQQQLLLAGYRPTDLSLDLSASGSPFAAGDAVDWRQPQTTLQMPSSSVIEVVQNVWWFTKRPTNVFLVVDTSGSMAEGDKLPSTQEALVAFITQMQGDRDRVGLIEFGSGVKRVEVLRRLDGTGRSEMTAIINNMTARGNTALLDAIWEAYIYLLREDDREAINAIVVMTDGQENASNLSLRELQKRFAQESGTSDTGTPETGTPVVIFTIGFGDDLDDAMLEDIARIGGGQYRRANETDIQELYRIISTYF